MVTKELKFVELQEVAICQIRFPFINAITDFFILIKGKLKSFFQCTSFIVKITIMFKVNFSIGYLKYGIYFLHILFPLF